MQYLLFCLAFLATIPPSIAKGTDQAPLRHSELPRKTVINHGLDADTSRYIQGIAEHFHVPSISIAVLNGNETTFEVFGHAILPDTLATLDTMYYIASSTKSSTAASLLYTLRQQEKTSGNKQQPWTVDSKLRDILGEDFALPSEYATHHATIKDALAHRLGLARCDESYGGEDYGISDLARSLRHLPTIAELRQQYHYLNQGYMLVQAVIQKLSGRWIGEVHREALWEPLGMDTTVIKLSDALELDRGAGNATLAFGYSYNPLTGRHDHQPWTDTDLVGGGGIISTISDMAKWVRAFVEGGASLPLGKQDFEALRTPLIITGGSVRIEHMSPILYAMGWDTMHYRGERLITHSGELPGYSSQMAYLPDRQWGLVMLSNADAFAQEAFEAIYLRLLDDGLDVPASDRQADLVPELDASLERQVDTAVGDARKRFYPHAPDPPVPRALPLQAYTGRYWNDGFRELKLRVEKKALASTPAWDPEAPVLRADWHRVVNTTIELEWVSGEQFLAWVETEVWSLLGGAVPAEFRVGADGKVESLGVYLEPSLIERGEMIWFDRIVDDDKEDELNVAKSMPGEL
ncbi:hypothetical protein PFICI_02055 [Pestalotiopsis fici W106-1]|uniref:Beta-lactamase-related domain-containing protein n=1 Tax=Pestalotiopsis fici (strain W106-1 / CGMCC3.15140) TaxID=1229662 RepID=W3XRV0_PESFW|nr:uncharacterized protein PFICI_02055 [Pestalotiopsis fici W106-1]ETS88227.1 hypothetical protein PFICI_02055 [Pestalotiopsis fici W106-1]